METLGKAMQELGLLCYAVTTGLPNNPIRHDPIDGATPDVYPGNPKAEWGGVGFPVRPRVRRRRFEADSHASRESLAGP